MTDQDMKARLRDQLGFLQRSAEAFDAGNTAEAIRIATVLRVIFHQTRKSTSLLTHLNATSISVRSKAGPESSTGARRVAGWSLAVLHIFPGGSILAPICEPQNIDTMVKVNVWWTMVFAVIDGAEYKRRDLVLWAANKDGGAHVADVIPTDYAKIRVRGAFAKLF
jgi:hypothetical protein